MHIEEQLSRTWIGKTSIYCVVILVVSSLLTVGMARTLDKKSRSMPQTPDSPTQVTLNQFNAYDLGGTVSLEWRSEYELNNLGYNVYREQDGVRTQINPSLIAGSALQAGQNVALTAGNTYAWRGKFAGGKEAQSTRFWLESIDLNSHSRWYGPVYVKTGDPSRAIPPQSKLLSDYSVEPENAQQREWASNFRGPSRSFYLDWLNSDISWIFTADEKVLNTPELDQQWSIAAQNAVKLAVNRDGWQRVTRAELLAAGLNPSASLANLKLYMNGIEQAMMVNGDGSIEFFGKSLLTQSTDTRIYWLVAGLTHGKRVNVTSAGPFDPQVQPASYPYSVERKDRTIRFPALLNGPGENFFGPVVNATPMRQTLQVTSLDQTAAMAQLEVGVQGLTFQGHQVRVQLNGADVGLINFSNRENGVGQFPVGPLQLRENKNSIQLSGVAGGSDTSLVDFVRLTYPRKYEASSNRMQFGVPAGQSVKVKGFTTPNLRVLDITDEANVAELIVSPQADSGGFAFTLPAVGGARTLLAIGAAGNFDRPSQITQNQPSSVHQTTNSANLLVITHGAFRQSLEPLRLLRESQGLQVVIVDVEDLYDEFSFGAHSPQAIRDFVLLTRTQWQTAPNYLLLVGDGTSDPRDYLKFGSLDLVPTMMVDGIFSEAPSDDSLADFDGDGIGDLPVGRFPVTTAQETTVIVNKILSYEQTSAGDTQQRGAVMVSDLTDANYNFEAFTAEVRTSLPPTMNVQLINRSGGDTATVRGQIMSAINVGPGVVNYLGHGSVGVWTGAGLLTTTDPPNFTNTPRLSLFVMMTCLNGAFTEVGTDSLAESILKAPGGGAVGVWASSGLTVPFGQVSVSKQFYTLLFTGQALRLGDATKAAKLATTDQDIRRFSIFFGDPSMRFR